MKLEVTYEGLDEWSRPLVKTLKGTTLCDTECTDKDVILKDPSRGHWHTVTADWGEPLSAIRSDVELVIVPKPTPKTASEAPKRNLSA